MPFQTLSDVQSVAAPGLAGMRARLSSTDVVKTLRNKSGQIKQVSTLTVGGSFAAGQTYAATINGYSYSYTSVSGDTNNTGVGASIKSELEQLPEVGGIFDVTAAAGVVTLTAKWPGKSYTLVSGTNLTAATSTSSDTADVVRFGRVVVETDSSEDAPLGAEAVSTLFTAQVDTHDITYDASVDLGVVITVPGYDPIDCSVNMATDAATSVEALKDEVNVQLDAIFGAGASIVATRSSDALVLTAEIAGFGFDSYIYFGPGRDTGANASTSTRSRDTAIQDCIIGIAEYAHDQEGAAGSGGATQYAANAGVRTILQCDGVLVSNSQSPSAGDGVFVELTAGSSQGLLYNTLAAGRVKLPNWSWGKDNAAEDLPEVSIRR